jgi:hypothetical protein
MKPLQISTSKQSIAGQQLLIKASTKHEENPQQTIKLVT